MPRKPKNVNQVRIPPTLMSKIHKYLDLCHVGYPYELDMNDVKFRTLKMTRILLNSGGYEHCSIQLDALLRWEKTRSKMTSLNTAFKEYLTRLNKSLTNDQIDKLYNIVIRGALIYGEEESINRLQTTDQTEEE